MLSVCLFFTLSCHKKVTLNELHLNNHRERAKQWMIISTKEKRKHLSLMYDVYPPALRLYCDAYYVETKHFPPDQLETLEKKATGVKVYTFLIVSHPSCRAFVFVTVRCAAAENSRCSGTCRSGCLLHSIFLSLCKGAEWGVKCIH